MVMVISLWPALHEFQPSATEDLPCRWANAHYKCRDKVPSSACCISLESEVPAQMSSKSLDYGLKLRGSLPIALALLYCATLINTHSHEATRELVTTDLIILSHGQVTRTTSELVFHFSNYHTLPSGGH
ncbi:hypothetical protein TNCV_2857991 [Trichonephila clavipes]|nr:hypothetical protein TNCV_2857991 [Trichonephila clavipes]